MDLHLLKRQGHSVREIVRLPVLIECHQHAFEFFGGVPASILYDNMKQVRLAPSQWNPAFLDFAGHCGFTPKTHQPYRPRTKGKVGRVMLFLFADEDHPVPVG